MAGFVTIVLCLIFLPPIVIYLIGCFQIGSWVGDFIHRKINE
jgi:hypothetical protein